MTTPRPWKAIQDDEFTIRIVYESPKDESGDSDREVVKEMGMVWEREKEAKANARLIVRAVNCHEELVAVARMAVGSQGWDGNDPNEDKWHEFYAAAQAVLRKAEEG